MRRSSGHNHLLRVSVPLTTDLQQVLTPLVLDAQADRPAEQVLAKRRARRCDICGIIQKSTRVHSVGPYHTISPGKQVD
jgi:hypothetical protein